MITHFHYTTWPDFGVPESPASFLNFLFKVRESGSLNPEHGPAVIHCSAGIGRSGTFSLVDTCLVLVSVLGWFCFVVLFFLIYTCGVFKTDRDLTQIFVEVN